MEPVLHKRHRIKLIKDLKLQNSKFRQSLIDFNQVQNLHKIYASMKKKLSIPEKKIDNLLSYRQQQPKKIQLSIQQKITIYKKMQHEKKLNDKMSKFYHKSHKKKFELENTPMKKIIQSFLIEKKQDKSSSYLNDLRMSQKELIYIKSNSKRQRQIEPQISPQFSRKKVISLETGLPKQFCFPYPTLQQCLKKLKPKQKRRKGSVLEQQRQLQFRLNSIYLTKQLGKQNKEKQPLSDTQRIYSSKIQQKKLFEKAKKNVNKSVKASQFMIKTLSQYLGTKREKKNQYQNLIETWKVDKPLTSELRRRNYKILGEQNEKKIEQYRYFTQKQRQEIIKKHYQFYSQLIKFIVSEIKHGQQLHFTKYICQQIRKKLQFSNRIDEGDVEEIISEAKKAEIKLDDISYKVLQKINELLKFNIDFSLKLQQ